MIEVPAGLEARHQHLEQYTGRFALRIPYAGAAEGVDELHLQVGHVWQYAQLPGTQTVGAWVIPADHMLLPPSDRGWMILVDAKWITCSYPDCALCSPAWSQLAALGQRGPVFRVVDVDLPPPRLPAGSLQVWEHGVPVPAEQFERRGVYLMLNEPHSD